MFVSAYGYNRIAQNYLPLSASQDLRLLRLLCTALKHSLDTNLMPNSRTSAPAHRPLNALNRRRPVPRRRALDAGRARPSARTASSERERRAGHTPRGAGCSGGARAWRVVRARGCACARERRAARRACTTGAASAGDERGTGPAGGRGVWCSRPGRASGWAQRGRSGKVWDIRQVGRNALAQPRGLLLAPPLLGLTHARLLARGVALDPDALLQPRARERCCAQLY